MSDGVTLEMTLVEPGAIDLAALMALEPKPVSPSTPTRMSLPELGTRLGFAVLIPTLRHLSFVEAAHVDAQTRYFGTLSDGALATWRLGSTDRIVVILQQRILTANGPMVFSYPRSIIAYQISVGGGRATIVLPPPDVSLCFATWIRGSMLLDVTFSWPVERPTVEALLQSLP